MNGLPNRSPRSPPPMAGAAAAPGCHAARKSPPPAAERGRDADPGGRRPWLISAVAALGAIAWARPAAAQSTAARPAGIGAAPEAALPGIGSRLILPSLPLLGGSTIGPAERRGKVVVLYWWASWCPFCAEQSPLMEALWRGHRDRDLLVVGLSIDRTPEIAAAHLARKGYTFPSAWLSPALSPVLAKPKGLPVTVVIGPDDKVLAAESGQLFDVDVEALGAFAGGRRRD